MVPDSVLQSELLTPSEKLLFPLLVVLCGAAGTTSVDNDELATYLKVSERSCSAFITNLNRAGFITVTVDRKLKKNQRTIRLNELTQDFALSPVLLQKLMLADADSCVKLAQILASALPDANSRVMLAQILASTNKEECADSQSFAEVDAKSCVNPDQISRFSGIRDNNIYNNILNTQVSNINTTINSIAKNLENSELTQDFASTSGQSTTPLIWLVGEPIAPNELGQLLELRGIQDDQVAPFIGEHTGRTYNDLKELRDLVRKWLRRQKPKAPKKSLDERKAEFKEKLRQFDKLNPGKYPAACYNNFFVYWTTPNDSGSTMRYERDSFFFGSLAQKLENNYKNIYLKNQTYANQSNNRAGTGKTVVLVSANDLSDDATDTDARAADSGSQADHADSGSGLTTIFVSMD